MNQMNKDEMWTDLLNLPLDDYPETINVYNGSKRKTLDTFVLFYNKYDFRFGLISVKDLHRKNPRG